MQPHWNDREQCTESISERMFTLMGKKNVLHIDSKREKLESSDTFFFFFLAMLSGLWDFSYPTRDGTHASCSGSAKSSPLDSQGSPSNDTFTLAVGTKGRGHSIVTLDIIHAHKHFCTHGNNLVSPGISG